MPRAFRNCLPNLIFGRRKKKHEEGQRSQGLCGTESPEPKQQLEAAHGRLVKNEEAWRRELCQKVRILVLGRSGAGKTTLIRLMVGKYGPNSISDDVAGVQDINKEFLFSSEEQGIPFIIHDSNGIDIKGKERVDEIKDFLDKHQKGDNFMDHVHVIWYVISAIDPRCVEDGDVMKMIGCFKIPLLLIMTHHDYDKVKVTDANLDLLLQGYCDVDEREIVKKLMVRVRNDGLCMGANNEVIIDESKRDREGLKLVVNRTQKLMDKKLRDTWMAG